MSLTYAEELRRMAYERTPCDMFLIRVADALEKLGRVEQAAYEAYDCLGDAEDIHAILARVCDPHTAHKKEGE